MTDLYLIAHKVRGEPAFDIACKIDIGREEGWIIPTSGHRAYPYWFHPLFDLYCHPNEGSLNCREMIGSDECPENIRDHYEVTRDSPQAGKAKGKIVEIDLADLGL